MKEIKVKLTEEEKVKGKKTQPSKKHRLSYEVNTKEKNLT